MSFFLGIISALSQGAAASASAKSEQNAAQYNATIHRQQAQQALEQANAQEEQSRRNSRKAIGSQRASLVENGIGLDGGTGSDLVQESSLNAEMDALNIRYQGALNSRGYSQQAVMDDNSASAAGNRAKQARIAGYLGAASSALSSSGAMYSSNAR